MHIKSVAIGTYQTKNNLFLAPLAGYTNYPFRKLCLSLGAGLAFTEMVSCKGLQYGNENTEKLLATGDAEELKAAQIFGRDPAVMRRACESEALAPFPIIDINMGCPMPKIWRNGEGSALLEEPRLAGKIIAECAKSGKTVTVKMRTGIDKDHLVTRDFAKMCEESGASLLTIHGRTRAQIYAGEADVKEIAAAKNAVKIPVIANGGVFSAADADRLMEQTGADGVMLARGALYDPRLFCAILQTPAPPLLPLFLTELDETAALYGERFALVFMRKMAAFYVKGMRGAAEIKNKLFAVSSVEELKSLVCGLDFS